MPRDYWLDPVAGSNANNALTSGAPAQTWNKINEQLVNAPPSDGIANVFIKEHNVLTHPPGKPGNYASNATSGTVTIPNTLEVRMQPWNPAAAYHSTDARLLSSTADFTDLGAGIWRTSTTFAVAGLVNKGVRVWRAGSAGINAMQNPDHELFEAASYADLGADESRCWTQVDSGSTWGASDTTPTTFAGMRTIYVYSPKGNPATVWGGLVILTQESNNNLLLRIL